jgi:hypothetical protein
MKINREARIAIMRGLGKRKVTPRRVWTTFAEDQGLGKPLGLIDRVERDFGESAMKEMLEILDASVPEREALPPVPPHRESAIRHALETKPETFYPGALPDELFARLTEIGWALFVYDYNDKFEMYATGGPYEPPSDAFINDAFEKNAAPCRMVEGRIDWAEQRAAEQPLMTDLENWPRLRAEIAGIRERFRVAGGADDYSDVGNRCIRAITALAELAFESTIDLPDGEEAPKADAAKRKLELYFGARLPGKDAKPMREASSAAWDIAQKIKHRQNPTWYETGVAVSALCLLVDLVEAARAPRLHDSGAGEGL